jgi:hypothetical protein
MSRFDFFQQIIGLVQIFYVGSPLGDLNPLSSLRMEKLVIPSLVALPKTQKQDTPTNKYSTAPAVIKPPLPIIGGALPFDLLLPLDPTTIPPIGAVPSLSPAAAMTNPPINVVVVVVVRLVLTFPPPICRDLVGKTFLEVRPT